MTDIQIETIPFSGATSHRGGNKKTRMLAAMEKLEPGRSFFIEASEFSTRTYAQIRTCAIASKLGIKAVLRDEQKGSRKGYRIYRIG